MTTLLVLLATFTLLKLGHSNKKPFWLMDLTWQEKAVFNYNRYERPVRNYMTDNFVWPNHWPKTEQKRWLGLKIGN